jgi:hypothetical protein
MYKIGTSQFSSTSSCVVIIRVPSKSLEYMRVLALFNFTSECTCYFRTYKATNIENAMHIFEGLVPMNELDKSIFA